MTVKAVFLICAQALLAQVISTQCIGAYDAWDATPYGPYAGPWNAAAPCAAGAWGAAPYAAAPCAAEWAYAPATLAASNGAGLAVTSASPIPPTGVAVTSENAYEGALAVSGALPFLGAVAVEGPLPTLGAGAVTYGCGNGNVAILNEEIGAAAFGPYGAYGAYGPAAELGYGAYGAYGPAAELGYGAYGAYGPAAELGYGYASAPLAYEAAFAGPSYGYRGCGAIY